MTPKRKKMLMWVFNQRLDIYDPKRKRYFQVADITDDELEQIIMNEAEEWKYPKPKF